MAEEVWYYATGNVQHGPYTLEEMQAFAREGRYTRESLCWEPGFGDRWRPAGSVPELFEPTPPQADGTASPPAFSAVRSEPDPFREPVLLSGVEGGTPFIFKSVATAFRRMRDVLFSQFNFARWMGIGFCSWLCSGIRLNLPNLSDGKKGNVIVPKDGSLDSFAEAMNRMLGSICDSMLDFFHSKEGIAVLAGALGAVLLFVLLTFYLNSRGAFMFLHRWYRPDERIRVAWRNSRQSANRLFRWEIGAFLFFLIASGFILAYGHRNILQAYVANGRKWDVSFYMPFAIFLGSFFGTFLTYTSARGIAQDFIVPVMYWQGCTAGAAWRSFFSLCWQRPFRIVGFYLMEYALFALWLLVYLLFVVGTLFIGGILMVLPFIGAVVLLPASFFFRGYSLAFLHQWREDLVPM